MSRGPWRFSFTYADVAAAAGMDERAVKRAKRRGEFNPRDLRSLFGWLMRQRIVELVR